MVRDRWLPTRWSGQPSSQSAPFSTTIAPPLAGWDAATRTIRCGLSTSRLRNRWPPTADDPVDRREQHLAHLAVLLIGRRKPRNDDGPHREGRQRSPVRGRRLELGDQHESVRRLGGVRKGHSPAFRRGCQHGQRLRGRVRHRAGRCRCGVGAKVGNQDEHLASALPGRLTGAELVPSVIPTTSPTRSLLRSAGHVAGTECAGGVRPRARPGRRYGRRPAARRAFPSPCPRCPRPDCRNPRR